MHQNFFLFLKYPLQIVGEFYLPIRHALLGLGGLSEIKKVISHPQALMQVENFVASH